jgi:hypothetical protein
MNLFDLRGGVGKERGIHGVIRDQTQKEKNAEGDQENPYDLVLQLFFDGIFYHGISSL